MELSEAAIGMYITNGSAAGRVMAHVARDPRWKRPSVKIMNIRMEKFGGNVGYIDTVPDYLLRSWEPVPFDWRPVKGGVLEERYTWNHASATLIHEYRKTDS